MTPLITTLLGLTSLLAASLVAMLLRMRGEPGARWLALMCAAVAGWSLSNAVQINSDSHDLKRATVGLTFLCICTTVYALWRAIISRTAWPWRVPASVAWMLAVPGVASAGLAMFSHAPGPYFRELTIPDGPGPVTGSPGELLVLHLFWSNVLILWALAGIAHIVWRIPRQRPLAVAVAVVAFAAPPAVNLILFATQLHAFGGNDLTPIATVPGALVLAVGIRWVHKLNVDVGLLPVARDTVLESMSDGVIVIDEHQRVVDLNPAAAEMLGTTPAAAIGARVDALVPGWGDEEREGAWEFTAGTATPARTVSARTGGLRGAAPGGLVLLRDVTEQHAVRSALELSLARHEHAARHDALTGLPNRTALFDRLRSLLVNGFPVSLLILDLNGFKALNDTFGHRVGDQVLRDLAGRLRGSVTFGTLVARLAGDEFAVALPEGGTPSAAEMANRLLDAINQPFNVEHTEVSVGASIGIAFGPRHGSDADELVHAADVAMYHAKRTSARWAVYEPSLDGRRPERLMLRHELRRAMSGRELEVHYQPQGTPGGRVMAVEALVRWKHPQRGLLAPGAFLPVCEDSDLMLRLTDQVLDMALADLERMDDGASDLVVSVNLSSLDLRDAALPQRIEAAITRHGADPRRLTVEVTENALVAAGDGLHNLQRVRDMGVRVSLDDFGTGSGPLATLRELPVDELKIDRSFVAAMNQPREAALVAGLIRLSHDLGLTVVAEGVESPDQATALTEMGCDLLQGYHIGRPRPPRRFTSTGTQEPVPLPT